MVFFNVYVIVVDCGPLMDPLNGRVDTLGSTQYLEIANYSCNVGYELIGDVLRQCQGNGEWGGEEPTCQSEEDDTVTVSITSNIVLCISFSTFTVVDCRGLLAVESGDVVYSTGTTYLSVAEVICHTGYELQGSPFRVCQENTNWAGNTPVCQSRFSIPVSILIHNYISPEMIID